MRKGCVAYSIRTRRRSFLDRGQGSDDFCQKKTIQPRVILWLVPTHSLVKKVDIRKR